VTSAEKDPTTGGGSALGQTKVYELLATGEIASIKIGSARRIPPQALNDYVAARMSAAAAHSDPTFDSSL
jgi:excisionase family DNA binding protein